MPLSALMELVFVEERPCNCLARLAVPMPTTGMLHRRLTRVQPSRERTVQKERALQAHRIGWSRESPFSIPLSRAIPTAAWPREPRETLVVVVRMQTPQQITRTREEREVGTVELAAPAGMPGMPS